MAIERRDRERQGIRILILEDSESDAALIVRQIRGGGIEPVWLRVETQDELERALDRQGWDVVLSDYAIPGLDAGTALATVKKKDPDLPFIVVSGFIGEDTAVNILKAGANDYLIKDRLERLVPAIEREIRDAAQVRARRRAEEAIQESEQRYHSLFQNLPNAFAFHKIMVNDKGVPVDYMFLEINDAYEKHAGIGRDTLLNRRVTEVIPEIRNDTVDWIGLYGRVALQGVPFKQELYSRVFDRWFWVQAYCPMPGYFVSIFEDISGRKEAEQRLREAHERTQRSNDGIIKTIMTIIENRDPYTAGHQKRVAELCAAVARDMGLGEERLLGIQMAALLHDIGKIYVPAEILSKPGKLSTAEINIIRTHAQASYDILRNIDFQGPVAQIALEHHERFNGSGYPTGLAGENIMLEARILAVADVVEAMISSRPYRSALGLNRALEEISMNRGTLFDPVVVDVFLRLPSSVILAGNDQPYR